MIVSSFEEELRYAPANPTSAWNNPYGPIQYGAAIPVGFGDVVSVGGKALGGTRGLGQVAALATANPVLGAVGAGLSIAQLIGNFLQPSQTGIFKQDATTLVNGLEAELKAVDAALRNNPTCTNQQQAIAFFWQVWAQLVSGCAQFGGPGTACVNDRAQGGKVSWFTYYLNPWTQMACTTPTSSSSDATGTTGDILVLCPH